MLLPDRAPGFAAREANLTHSRGCAYRKPALRPAVLQVWLSPRRCRARLVLIVGDFQPIKQCQTQSQPSPFPTHSMATPAVLVRRRKPVPNSLTRDYGGFTGPEQHSWRHAWSVAGPAACRKLPPPAAAFLDYSWPPADARGSGPGFAAGLEPHSLISASGSGRTCVSEASFSHKQLSFGVMGNGRAAGADDTSAQAQAQARRQEGSMPPKRSAAANKTKLPDVSGVGAVRGREGRVETRAWPVQV